ncbi:MAG: hypothetical protein IID46_10660 [Planctomycetes bacterium]|nr:hypothetical protein [Planctomycetota bacterium]
MGKLTANRKTPSESLTGMQRDRTESPLMNWMDGNQKPEPAPTGRFKLKFPTLAQRILFIPLRRLFSFLQSHLLAIGATIAVVVILALFFVYRPDGAVTMQLDNSEIHFDDVTIHPLRNTGSVTNDRSSRNDNDSPGSPGLSSSVSATQSELTIFPIHPATYTIHNSSDEKHAAWLTGKIEFDETSSDETSQSRSLPGRARIGQRLEYFSHKRD